MYKVLKSFKGSPDGYTVIDYVKDEEVDLVPELADVALKEKWVKKLEKKAAPVPEAQLPLDPVPPADPAVPPAPTFESAGTDPDAPAGA